MYLSELRHVKQPSRYNLRSDQQQHLVIPKTRCKPFGDRAFAVAGPKLWNNLPLSIRQSGTTNDFESNLKTYLFQDAFGLKFYIRLEFCLYFHRIRDSGTAHP